MMIILQRRVLRLQKQQLNLRYSFKLWHEWTACPTNRNRHWYILGRRAVWHERTSASNPMCEMALAALIQHEWKSLQEMFRYTSELVTFQLRSKSTRTRHAQNFTVDGHSTLAMLMSELELVNLVWPAFARVAYPERPNPTNSSMRWRRFPWIVMNALKQWKLANPPKDLLFAREKIAYWMAAAALPIS